MPEMAGIRKGARKALEYEVCMFKELQPLVHSTQPPVLHDAVVVSVLLHTRILADFLLSRGDRKQGDIRVKDVLPAFVAQHADAIEALRGTWGDRNKGPCEELNKRLVHFTDRRVGGYDYTAFALKVIPKINSLIEALEAELSDEGPGDAGDPFGPRRGT